MNPAKTTVTFVKYGVKWLVCNAYSHYFVHVPLDDKEHIRTVATVGRVAVDSSCASQRINTHGVFIRRLCSCRQSW